MGPPINLYRQLPPSAARVHVPGSGSGSGSGSGRSDSAAVPPAEPKSVRIEKAYAPPIRRTRRVRYPFGWLLGGMIATGASIGWWLRPHVVPPAHDVPRAATIQAHAQSVQSPVVRSSADLATTVSPGVSETSRMSMKPRYVERAPTQRSEIKQPVLRRLKSSPTPTLPQSRLEATRLSPHGPAHHHAHPLARSTHVQDSGSAMSERVMTNTPEEISTQAEPVQPQDWMRYLSHRRITDIPDQFTK